MGDYGAMCPVFRPTREEFEQPFCDYVKKIFRKNPDLAMFKVVPPRGWKPRRTPFPDLRKVQINVPIRQHVFGTKGAYRCVFVEQKPMSVAEFKLATEEEAARLGRGANGHVDGVAASVVRASTRSTSSRHNRPPPDHESNPGAHQRGAGEGESAEGAGGQQLAFDPDAVDADMERSFWANVTMNPPMYGADTPTSFFDDKLPYGWNLQHLGDLLQNHPKVDSVPGVTTPMTYFGMWRSFFGWHKEDADLYSVNFLHWGAPKIWYGVAPSARYKFERMAQSLFPELHRSCPAFVRHKDIMMSPSCLKTYGVPMMRACQRPNEFVVLNAAAYHAGFNSGFNCAEAVNFAMKEWIPVGKEAVPCRCSALKDGVRISMKLFDPKWVDPYETPSEATEEEEQSSEEEEEEEEGAAAKRRCSRGKLAAPTKRGGAQKKRGRSAEEYSEQEEGSEEPESGDEESGDEEAEEGAKPRRRRVATKKALAAEAEAAAKAKKRGKLMVRKGKKAAATTKTTALKTKKATATKAVKKPAVQKVTVKVPLKKVAVKKIAVKTPSTKAAAAKRGPGRPRKAAATAAHAIDAAPAAPEASGRKRKAHEEDSAIVPATAAEEVDEEQQAAAMVAAAVMGEDQEQGRVLGAVDMEVDRNDGDEADGPRAGPTEGGDDASGRGGRPRRAAAKAAAALVAAATRKRPRTTGRTAIVGAAAANGDVGGGADGKGPVRGSGGRGIRQQQQQRDASDADTVGAGPAPEAAAAAGAAAPAAPTLPEINADGKLVVTAVKPRSTVAAAAMALKARTNTPSQEPVIGPPMAIVGDADTASGRRPVADEKRFFFLVQRLARPAPTPGNVLLRWLKEGRDGLFRPVAGSVWEEPAGALLPVRVLAVFGDTASAAATATPPAGGNASEDGEHGGALSSSSSGAGGGDVGVGGGDADGCGPVAGAGMGPEPEAWRLVTPREQIVDVELRQD